MFRRARVRLTSLYLGLFALVLGAFNIVFYVGFATVLSPTFDVGPELTSSQVAEATYQGTVARIGLALLAADLVVVLLVGGAAWVLAARTLKPIREAHARQRRFVADASHEMRTPLTAIRATAESALQGSHSNEDLRQALRVVVGSAAGLTRITNDLLVLARADDMPLDRTVSPIDLSVVVAEAVEHFELAHRDLRRAELDLAHDVVAAADPTEIERIVANLLDNALRYGGEPAAAPPRIATRANEREAIIEVIDDGPGIAAADIERIFEPFHRVHADADTPAGNGLGLAIARSLALRNRGRLTVTSEPGRGATFRLALPVHVRFTQPGEH